MAKLTLGVEKYCEKQPFESNSSEYKCSAVADMGDRLDSIDMGRKVGGCSAPFWGIGEGRKPKQLQGTSTDVEWPIITSLIITSEDEMSV